MTSGRACTCSELGAYWISSNISVRYTTWPGVLATLRPSLNGVGSTCEGSMSLSRMSRTMFLRPLTRLSPPVSTILRSATGLASSQLLGANASVTSEVKKCARPLPRASSEDRSMKRVRCSCVTQWACISRLQRKFDRQAGSAKRRSFGSGIAADAPATTLRRSFTYAPRGAIFGDFATTSSRAPAAAATSRPRRPIRGLNASAPSAASAITSVSSPAVRIASSLIALAARRRRRAAPLAPFRVTRSTSSIIARLLASGSVEKFFDRARGLLGARQQEEVAAIEYLQLGVGNEAADQARVHQRHDRVVPAGHHQRGLFQSVQPMNARPAGGSRELEVVAEPRLPSNVPEDFPGQTGVAAEIAAVDVAGYPLDVLRAHEASRSCHLQEHARACRHHQRSRRRGAEDQAPSALRFTARELLCSRAAPGDAQHVASPMTKMLQHLRGQPGDAPQAVGPPRQR